jgi:hypothetical protein
MGAVPQPVLTAIKVVLRCPFHVVADQPFKVTVFVVVELAGTGQPLPFVASGRFGGDIGWVGYYFHRRRLRTTGPQGEGGRAVGE